MNMWHVFDSLIYGKYSLVKMFYRYLRAIVIFFAIFLLIFALYFGRKQWILWRDQSAQKSLAKLSKRLKKYREGTLPKSDIFELHPKIASEEKMYKNAKIAPYFSALHAQVCIEEGKLESAVETLEKAVAESSNPVIFSQLETTRALILLDINPEQGITALQKLIADTANPMRDVAQFYLGKYYWIHDNIELATVIWREFLQEQSAHQTAQSPFKAEVEIAIKSLPS